MSNNSDSEIFFEIEELEETSDMETAEINHKVTTYYCESCDMNFSCLDEVNTHSLDLFDKNCSLTNFFLQNFSTFKSYTKIKQ